MKELNQELISKLEKLYGHFDKDHKKFDKAPNSVISRELGYSDAQFSRLINDKATEGEYQRANQNADRILSIIDLEEKVEYFKQSRVKPRWGLIIISILVTSTLLGFAFHSLFYGIDKNQAGQSAVNSKFDMLTWSFESNYINPYKGLRELPDDCDYACYRYQGKWELESEYKLPFLRERSGFHYLAKSAIMYARCNPRNNPEGKNLEAYEYQLHEIWYDKLERSIGVFIHENGDPLDTYQQMNFAEDENFVKIATIHSFYTNDFTIDSTRIYRSGQDIGRDLEFVPQIELADEIDDLKLLEKLRQEITLIVQDPLKDYSKPSSCDPSVVPAADFHSISEGNEMTFNCEMTTAERFSINYIKTYVLIDQFIKEKCVSINL